MKLKFICPFWGSESLSAVDFLSRVKADGYDGAEVNIPEEDNFGNILIAEAKKNDLVIIGQQWLPPANETFSQYKNRFEKNLFRLNKLNPLFINSHTGKDYYSFEENAELIVTSFKIAKESQIPIFHETHRGRFSFHASSLIPYLDRFPELALTADFSHWCNVSESMLEDQNDIIRKIIPHINYLHARIGHEQAPQVNDPRSPEWSKHLSHFLNYWDLIFFNHSQKNTECFYICPEFGPPPYLQVNPWSCKPLNNQREINLWMKNLLKERYKNYTN